MKLTDKEIKHREEILEEAVREYGADTVDKWMKDTDKVSLINAMCHLDCVSKTTNNGTQ